MVSPPRTSTFLLLSVWVSQRHDASHSKTPNQESSLLRPRKCRFIAVPNTDTMRQSFALAECVRTSLVGAGAGIVRLVGDCTAQLL